MSSYYKKKTSGKEYVDATKKFVSYTMHLLTNLPKEWVSFITSPAAAAAQNIEDNIIRANKVYIPQSSDDPKEKIKAFEERLKYLYRAYREFTVFDTKYEHVLDKIDLMLWEKERLGSILSCYVEEAKKNGDYEGEIKIITRATDVQFVTPYGSTVTRLKLTPKQNDHLLDLEEKAKTEISKRITSDNTQIKELRKL